MKLPEIIFGDNNLKISLDECKGELIVGFVSVSDSRYRRNMFSNTAARKASSIHCVFTSIPMS